MLDGKKVLEQLLGSGAASGFAGGLAGGVLGGVLTSKKGRKLAGSAVKVGGLALIGGLAYNAWRNHKQAGSAPVGVAPAPETVTPAFLPQPQDAEGCSKLGLLLARATISAAKADGQIDAQEGRQILETINSAPLDAEEKAFLLDQYHAPLDMAGLARSVDTPEHAAEVYAASVLVVHPPSPPERIYLDALGKTLGLQPGLAQRIEDEVAAGVSAG